MKVLIVGTGVIARELERLIRLQYPDWQVEFFSSKRQRNSFYIAVMLCDIVFVTISTKDNGLAAAQYIQEALQLGKLVVTCEKGALSEYFHVFRRHMRHLGYATTVGGASGMLGLLRDPRIIIRMRAILNGSCNNISTLVEQDVELELSEGIFATQQAGYTDPGAKFIHQIINGELADACRKAVILHNLVYPEYSVRYSDMSRMPFSEDGVYQLFNKQKDEWYAKRLIVEIGPYADTLTSQHDAGIPCFWFRNERVHITGSFKDPGWLFPMIPRGIQNCLRTEYVEGKADFQYGDGAGVTATAQAMLIDAEQLLESN